MFYSISPNEHFLPVVKLIFFLVVSINIISNGVFLAVTTWLYSTIVNSFYALSSSFLDSDYQMDYELRTYKNNSATISLL